MRLHWQRIEDLLATLADEDLSIGEKVSIAATAVKTRHEVILAYPRRAAREANMLRVLTKPLAAILRRDVSMVERKSAEAMREAIAIGRFFPLEHQGRVHRTLAFLRDAPKVAREGKWQQLINDLNRLRTEYAVALAERQRLNEQTLEELEELEAAYRDLLTRLLRTLRRHEEARAREEASKIFRLLEEAKAPWTKGG